MRSGSHKQRRVAALACAAALVLTTGAAKADTTTDVATTTTAPSTTTTATTATTTTSSTVTAPAPTTVATTTALTSTTAAAPTTTAPTTAAPPTTTEPTTTTAIPTTAPATTTVPPAPTTAPASTTTPTTTRRAPAPSHLAPPAPKPAAPAPATAHAVALTRTPATGKCPRRAGIAIRYPDGHVVLVTAASGRWRYPADGSIIEVEHVSGLGRCASDTPLVVRGITLFGGLVEIGQLQLAARGGAEAVSGLSVAGRRIAFGQATVAPMQDFGFVVASRPVSTRRLAAAHESVTVERSVVSIELTHALVGLPAGTQLLLPFATTTRTLPRPAPATKRGPVSRPLTVTPRLEGGPYTFPLVGPGVSFGDSYGGGRSDVSGGWHHGDDIFAPLGTPVVAVASGTLNRVGWERIGGWRLWVRDKAGDEFYYAHLSGYTALALHDGHVHAGQVLGFVGNTGDAFTTMPHLHFEVHPRSLLHLQYDGAVDPTRYLDSWQRLGAVKASQPLHPRFPRLTAARVEADTNWRELLAVRAPDVHKHTARPPRSPHFAAAPVPPTRVAAAAPHGAATSPIWWPFALAAALVAALGLLMLRANRRRQQTGAG